MFVHCLNHLVAYLDPQPRCPEPTYRHEVGARKHVSFPSNVVQALPRWPRRRRKGPRTPPRESWLFRGGIYLVIGPLLLAMELHERGRLVECDAVQSE